MQSIASGYAYNKGHFMERVADTNSATLYKEDSRETYFYKESVVFPYVDLSAKLYKGETVQLLTNTEKSFILNFMDEHGCAYVY